MTARELLRTLQLNGYKYLQRDGGVGALYALKNATDEEGLCIEPDNSNTSFIHLVATDKLYDINYLLGDYKISNDIRNGLQEFGYEMVFSSSITEVWKCDDNEFVIMKG